MSSRVLLHVGTPKTGTSYLQEVLYRNQRVLGDADLLYPAERFDAHFLAALDLMRLPWGGLEVEAIGAWDRLAAKVRAHHGTAIISHEILARATTTQVTRALESLGHGTGTEIHVIISARDLVRQIPAEWQENVKHRATLSYREFLDQLQDPDREGRIANWFWGVQELPDILARWGHDLPPEQVHLVTVPPQGGDRALLWKRFSAAFGLDGLPLDLEAERVNPSLGVPETALVRRVNKAAGAVPPWAYRPLVRELLAHQTLSRRTGSPRLALPTDVHPWVVDLQQAWLGDLRTSGYDVVGDLDDLAGAAPTEFVDPDAPSQRQVANAAVASIRALLLDNTRLMREARRRDEELEDLRQALERSYLRPSHRLRAKIVRGLQEGRVGRGLLAVYRRARGRNSRPA